MKKIEYRQKGVIDLAKLAKKIKINQVLNVDRQKVKKGELPKNAKPLTVKMVRAEACSTTCPQYMTTTSSAISLMTPRSCVMKMMEVPFSR